MTLSPSPKKVSPSKLFHPKLAKIVQAQVDNESGKRQKKSLAKNGTNTKSIITGWQGDRFYKGLGVGRFEGRVRLIWNGADSFVFDPHPDRPFSYFTSEGWQITPKTMYTDGGSTPTILHGMTRFSPWGYGPAYLIHDWLFAAHQCIFAPDNTYTFSGSAEILAEAIKTLMEVGFEDWTGNNVRAEKAEDTLYLIYQGVSSSIAKGLWDNPGTVKCIRSS